MVKKLLKHEFVYYFRTFSVAMPIVLVIAVMARLFRMFGIENPVQLLTVVSSHLLLVVACFALLGLSTWFSIIRFYKNMYSQEGYLTFALPVSNNAHIFAKLFAAIICEAACVLTICLAGIIALSGEILGDMVLALSIAKDFLFDACGVANCITYAFELILIFFFSAVSSILLSYACITVGQTAKKNRIFMAVVAYFVYYVATQVVSTVFSILFVIFGLSGLFNGIALWFVEHPFAAIHIELCLGWLITAAMSAAFWIVTHRIMSKRLNLE